MKKSLAPIWRIIKQGTTLTILDKQNYDSYLASQKDGELEMIVRKARRIRGLNQNALYWAYLGIIEHDTGNFSYDLHEYFKKIFLQPKFVKIFGLTRQIPKSTTELSKMEFADYMQKIEVETGIPIPDKNKFDI